MRQVSECHKHEDLFECGWIVRHRSHGSVDCHGGLWPSGHELDACLLDIAQDACCDHGIGQIPATHQRARYSALHWQRSKRWCSNKGPGASRRCSGTLHYERPDPSVNCNRPSASTWMALERLFTAISTATKTTTGSVQCCSGESRLQVEIVGTIRDSFRQKHSGSSGKSFNRHHSFTRSARRDHNITQAKKVGGHLSENSNCNVL